MRKLFFFALPLALVAAVAFTVTSCSSSNNNDDGDDDSTLITGMYELSKVTDLTGLTFDALTYKYGSMSPYWIEFTEAERVNVYVRGQYEHVFQKDDTSVDYASSYISTSPSNYYSFFYTTTTFSSATTVTYRQSFDTYTAPSASASTSADGTLIYKFFLGETKIVDGKQCFVTDKGNLLIQNDDNGVATLPNGEKILVYEDAYGKYYEKWTLTETGFIRETWRYDTSGNIPYYHKYEYVKK